MALRLIRVRPGDRLSCHRHPWEALLPLRLDASTGASGPHDFTVRSGIVRPHIAARNTIASTATSPNVCDDGRRPSGGKGWRILTVFLPADGSGMFFARRLDGWNRVDRVEEISLRAQAGTLDPAQPDAGDWGPSCPRGQNAAAPGISRANERTRSGGTHDGCPAGFSVYRRNIRPLVRRHLCDVVCRQVAAQFLWLGKIRSTGWQRTRGQPARADGVQAPNPSSFSAFRPSMSAFSSSLNDADAKMCSTGCSCQGKG